MARYIDADEFFQTLGFYEQSFDVMSKHCPECGAKMNLSELPTD